MQKLIRGIGACHRTFGFICCGEQVGDGASSTAKTHSEFYCYTHLNNPKTSRSTDEFSAVDTIFDIHIKHGALEGK